ncbi:MAG: sulfite exporter TauE/SafE family protein [Desulfovibrio sp.]|uniref:sulfite exporter TauE/SafE family protein n=2 Tax=Desulfovibrio sp. TaxID=885 RepID=UPI002A363065|nr:sulfite exporter TauE/SafE family protein [Desulfovibrio sp.]MDY0258251.1 sulfite exporter TauE/SafE family protein [Desulfovibrio sp.]
MSTLAYLNFILYYQLINLKKSGAVVANDAATLCIWSVCMFILLALVAILVGALIGTVGVGGILLIPALNELANLPIQVAMGTALFSFIFTGVLGTWLYQRHGSIDWGITVPVCLGALLSGYVGALCNGYATPRLLEILLGSVIIFAGVYALLPACKKSAEHHPRRRLPLLLGIGALVGFGSGLTGVGGPVLSVPLMVILGFAPLTAIATSQVIQITAALSGTLGNVSNGAINFTVAAWVTVLELVGVILGAGMAHTVSTATLKKTVSVVCILVGGFILTRALIQS